MKQNKKVFLIVLFKILIRMSNRWSMPNILAECQLRWTILIILNVGQLFLWKRKKEKERNWIKDWLLKKEHASPPPGKRTPFYWEKQKDQLKVNYFQILILLDTLNVNPSSLDQRPYILYKRIQRQIHPPHFRWRPCA